ncbi:MAG: methyl-accepting chemotaxis protein [Spirochaetales bacterium]|nr:methyl-accepting chemotaxis protein [Spirochaetales bacterium]
MLKRFLNFHLSAYFTASMEVQKKAKNLLIFNYLSISVLIFTFLFLQNFPGIIGFFCVLDILIIISIILLKRNKYQPASVLSIITVSCLPLPYIYVIEPSANYIIFFMVDAMITSIYIAVCLIAYKKSHILITLIIGVISFIVLAALRFPDFNVLVKMILDIRGIVALQALFIGGFMAFLVMSHNKDLIKIAEEKAEDYKKTSGQTKQLAESLKKSNDILTEIISKAKELTINLNSSTKEIEAAAQEQTNGSNEFASGITEVSATLEELTITAKQITKNVGDLVFSSEEVIKFLQSSESKLLKTVSQLEDAGKISKNNTGEINELGKRSILINEMVELIKNVANKTNILSINASIEASRAGEIGAGFSVVAAEIRELSKETILSAKNVEKAAGEIQNFLNSIILSSESESEKVIGSGKIVKQIFDDIENVVGKINDNYSFTQKIDVSIKQQENGSKQASDTMKQMSEISRQSAETARQILKVVRDIVKLVEEIDVTVKKIDLDEE